MSRVPHPSAFGNTLDPRAARIGQTAESLHPLAIARAANTALLDHLPYHAVADELDGGDGTAYVFSYAPHPTARFLRVEARIAPDGSDIFTNPTVSLDLEIADELATVVPSTDDRIPTGWVGEVHYAPILYGQQRYDSEGVVVGYLDVDALAVDLTGESWALTVTVATAAGALVSTLEVTEIPRGVVDDEADGGGILPGSFQGGVAIHDGTQDGLVRLHQTSADARVIQQTLIHLAWPQTVTPGDTPLVTGTSWAPVIPLDSATGKHRVKSRPIDALSIAGQATRFRFLYRMSAGTSETAEVRLAGGATGSPWTSATLTYTTDWTWSPWITAAQRTDTETDLLGLEGRLSGPDPVLWVATIDVRTAVG